MGSDPCGHPTRRMAFGIRPPSGTMPAMQPVRVAVFPAAGLGTRFLPATKAQPKEMLPLVDRPLVQYVVEEAKAAGIERIVIVTGRGKNAIEDHFDTSFELEKMLEERGKDDLLAIVREISDLIPVSYVRQKTALGLGHAILQAKDLAGVGSHSLCVPDLRPLGPTMGGGCPLHETTPRQNCLKAYFKDGTSSSRSHSQLTITRKS